MHLASEPEEKEEEKNLLKRKFYEIDRDQPSDNHHDHQMGDTDGPDCPSSKRNSSSSPPLDINPRGYQLNVFEVARKRNTIAVLETGTGKTMIAIMLIRDIGLSVKSTVAFKRLIIFLAPTVSLVQQQYGEIKMQVNLEVGEYYGAKGVDQWTSERWEKEVKEHHVLVMTPQIFLDALRKAFLNLETVCLVVIDECHRATGNHPYAKIMKEFYHKSTNKPKIFGMTASPVIRKGVSCASDCVDQISELESLLDAQIFTPDARMEVEMFAPTAKQVPRFYDPSPFCSLELKARVETSFSKFDASLLRFQERVKDRFHDMEDKFKTLQKRLSGDHAKILHCLDNLGLICAYEAVKVCLENISNTKEEFEIYREFSMLHKEFLTDIFSIVGEYLQQENMSSIDNGRYDSSAVNLGHVSPKLHELLKLFRSFGDEKQTLCLIFVERIITAKVIERFVKKVASLAHLNVSYLTGSNNSADALAPKMAKEILESFRSGKVNLLFATDVVEEGIHVPNCSCVVRFDLPKTVRSYVQSRGRARQNNSEFIVLLERGNTKQRDHLFDLSRSEVSMRDTALGRDPETPNSKLCIPLETNVYRVKATGALVTLDSSISVLRRYCEQLPTDEYTPELKFELSFPKESSYMYALTFPACAAVPKIVGPPNRSRQLAKQLACLEACKKLHQLGALDDHLLPQSEESTEKDASAKSKSSSLGAGTKKRKELHGTTCVNALSGTWGEKVDGAVFQGYKFHFSCNIAGEIFSSFVLLIESTLDEDVGNVEMDLYLVSKLVKASVSSCGQLYLNPEETVKAKCFQEFFFNGLFGKLFVGSKLPEKKREFLLQTETRSLWNPSYMFLLLPLDTNDLGSEGESWRINWPAIDSCVSVVGFLKKNALLEFRVNDGNHCNTLLGREGMSEDECGKTNLIHFANGSFNTNSLAEMVVIAIHTGRIYSIVEVVKDSSANSPFEDAASPEFASYADYFYKRYGIVLMHPNQPLMRLKQSHNAHNLLVNFSEEGDLKAGPEAAVVRRKPQIRAHLPPELLACINVPRAVIKSIYLLPSLMHRLESLMLASQLRKEIDCHVDNFSISSSLILEALTTLLCCETFSMERLELLGDSVLKYIVSCHLFLKYPDKNEGQLTRQRSSIISNSNLHRLATNHKLQEYIRDGAFEPRRWTAPGQRTLFPVPCKCGVDAKEVPLDSKFFTENLNVKLGKSCDMGHRWMVSKSISDCAEALIGAYYVSGGLAVALHMMKWLGVDIEFDPQLVIEAINMVSLRSYVPRNDELTELEAKIGHEFSVKFILKEAITHTSMHEPYCYQRLEFLGDSVLDILITRHLYNSYTETGPGEMTDLRSACVCNENFAQVAVRKNLYNHLQHCSTVLETQINEYLESFPEPDETGRSTPAIQGPKALGDLVESIAGALLIDLRTDLNEVWRVFEPLLSPLVTPDKLELPPFRELNELCDSLGYSIRIKCVNDGAKALATLQLQLDSVLLAGQGSERTNKLAKGKAASCLLEQLEKRNISRNMSTRDKQNGITDHQRPTDAGFMDYNQDNEVASPSDSTGIPCSTSLEMPAIGPINMKKGGPRTTLFDFCKKQLWPMPTFEPTEEKSRTPIEFGEGSEKRTSFSSFVSTITLRMPNREPVTCRGEARPDKKSSYDSAALKALYELERRGNLIIQK